MTFREKIFSISLVVFGGAGLCVVVYSIIGQYEFVIPYALVLFFSAICALISKSGKT